MQRAACSVSVCVEARMACSDPMASEDATCLRERQTAVFRALGCGLVFEECRGEGWPVSGMQHGVAGRVRAMSWASIAIPEDI